MTPKPKQEEQKKKKLINFVKVRDYEKEEKKSM